MKILITGGAGYIGNVLVNKLFAASSAGLSFSPYDTLVHKVKTEEQYSYNEHSHIIIEPLEIVVYDNLMYRQVCLTDHCYRKGFTFVNDDVCNKDKLIPWIEWADIIIPLAALVGVGACEKNTQAAWDINYGHIETIVKHLKPHQKIIYPNTNSGYGLGFGEQECTEESKLTPISIYGKSKCKAEQLILDSGQGIVLRLATVFGASPRMRLDLLVNDFTYKAFTDGYLVLFEKDFKRNYIHVQDVALTFVYMINTFERHKGKIFNVGLSSANLSKLELANKIKEEIPDLVIKWDDFKEDPDKRNYIVSNKKLEQTGWIPYYSLEDGIKELIKAYEIVSHNRNQTFTNL